MRAIAMLSCLMMAHASADNLRHIDLQEALKIVADNNPNIIAAKAYEQAARATSLASIGRMLPNIVVSDEAQQYKKPFVLSQFGGLVARNTETNMFMASATQPLLGLLKLVYEYEAAHHYQEASTYDIEATRMQLELQLQVNYLRFFEAQGLTDIAMASERTLREQVLVARSQFEVGASTKADILRIEVAAANANQLVISTHAQAQILRASLIEMLGFGQQSEQIIFVEPRLDNVAIPDTSHESIRDMALHLRPEIASMAQQVMYASHIADAKRLALLPDIDVEASYMHMTGQIFTPQDSSYVGIKAHWAIWDWGSRFYESSAAAANHQASIANLDNLQRRIATEVAQRAADAEAASSAVHVAQLAEVSAQEALRVVQALVQAGSATTTDILDAEAAFTRARINLVQARHNLAIAYIALNYAVGMKVVHKT